MKRAEYDAQVKKAIEYYKKAHIVLTDAEKQRIEVADFGLGHARGGKGENHAFRQ